MYRVLIVVEPPIGPDELLGDLEATGFNVVAVEAEVGALARTVVRTAPDVIVAGCHSPSEHLFQAAQVLATVAPCPFVLFTSDGDLANIERATDSGIHAYVVEGYARHRLLSVVQVARARYRREQILRNELSDLTQRHDERKHVDRAKGVLMQSRGVSEEQAFEVLRHLAMNSRQRIGVIAQSVVDASRLGDALNKAGQLRMLSQRVVRCYVQGLLEPDLREARSLLTQSAARVVQNLAALTACVGAPSFGATAYQHLLNETVTGWHELQSILDAPADAAKIATLDAGSERMLDAAERLTTYLEASGLTPSWSLLNIAGRQRMLSQRIAKLCFLLAFETNGERLLRVMDLSGEFQRALDRLHDAPLSSEVIKDGLRAVNVEWRHMKDALNALQHADALGRIAKAADSLLEGLDVLSRHYEQAMQVLVGNRMGRLR